MYVLCVCGRILKLDKIVSFTDKEKEAQHLIYF